MVLLLLVIAQLDSQQLVSLTLDGVTGATQENMRSVHKTGPFSMMLFVNVWSILWLALGLYFTCIIVPA